MRNEQHPKLTPAAEAINKLNGVRLDGFANGISADKNLNLCHGIPRTHGLVRDWGVCVDRDGVQEAVFIALNWPNFS